ncbi:tRNA (guanosine(46)-N7)-methyltransferase TrmB [Ancylomarina sp. 16SWW S1-10-2]|uniref:tRNA (guanosine(46)-N7)-methyltransferase TrmB n=1 Tax=Ancylomarina sp. 16SWW S1-10-2 TaxID=2499681 RepID=UPI001D73DA07|nr:tRNA (guanosine(46)-N7)-methyltransferase TrmB [Ancylomarina sp. 16SWW S1-10-2]
MAKNKLKRFAQMETFENVFQPSHEDVWDKEFRLKNKWNKAYFKNDNPIVLEVGCGKGEYTVGLAQRFPDKNFIGIDIKGARLWQGATIATEEGLKNVAFVRTNVELLRSVFSNGEISEIWITFADPQMKKVTKRLTGTRFMKLYSDLMNANGIIHLKSDSQFLYQYTKYMIQENKLKVLTDTDDLYNSEHANDILGIKTYYEAQFLSKGIPIKYIQFLLEGKTEFVEPDVELELDEYRSFGRDRRIQTTEKSPKIKKDSI